VSVRTFYSAAHVVAASETEVDWDSTLAYRRHLASLGLGIAEAMDTAQRGMGLSWADSLLLIRRTRDELAGSGVPIFNGCGTDHLDPGAVRTLDDVVDAYLEQVDAIQAVGGRLILMASRALARVARSPDDYLSVYRRVLARAEAPVVLHWLGDMFDPELLGYWGTSDLDAARDIALQVIAESTAKVDGIKISLLDKAREIDMRRRLPAAVKMYTGDDFNYPELIAGDDEGYSHALLGIFDAIAPAASMALGELASGNTQRFLDILAPTVPLSRRIFGSPTRYGNMCAQMRNFLDQTGGLWMKGALERKVAGVFTSTGTQHGGQETTIASFHNTLLHLGMIITGVPYSEQRLLNMDEISGGSPYGAGTLAGADGSRQPSENELAIARTQGRHVASITAQLKRGSQ